MDYSDRHVVVTGGTGALGTAVVGALVEGGATCYVPWRHETEAQQFPFRKHNQVKPRRHRSAEESASVASFLVTSPVFGRRSMLLAALPWAPWPKPQKRSDPSNRHQPC